LDRLFDPSAATVNGLGGPARESRGC